MAVEHRVPTYADVAFLAANMRPIDADEVRAASHDPLEEIVARSVRDSFEAHSVFINNELVSIWGIWEAPDLYAKYGRVGIGWLLSTRGIEKNPKVWLNECRRVMSELVQRWDAVIGAIDLRHHKSLRWADRLGFELGKHEVMGVENRPFVWFRFSKDTLNV